MRLILVSHSETFLKEEEEKKRRRRRRRGKRRIKKKKFRITEENGESHTQVTASKTSSLKLLNNHFGFMNGVTERGPSTPLFVT